MFATIVSQDHEVVCNIPVIQGCMVQWYWIVPVPFIMADPEEPTFISEVSNEPLIAVAVWGAVSLLIQVILDPTESWAGLGR